ncbi:MAG: NADH-quinone oxidoreductase subunit L [Acidobacteria bacterium]|nr:NADH-quinone oxidoreductase subunit L [Acidobacteriota bacterium]
MHLWLIPALPLAGFLINGLAGRRLSKGAINAVALGSVTLAFLWALRVFAAAHGFTEPHVESYFTWIESGPLSVAFSFYLDRLTLVILLVVTGVGMIIHFYSVGYMAHEGGYYRFFAFLNLFMFFMLLLVLASSFLLMFVGWEGVGLCSYLLIGFWFRRQSATDAGNKAFIVNRIGDFGFSLGMFLIFLTFGSFDFETVFAKATAVEPATLTIIALLLFVGATGKSAQMPLYVWLPDAMEGPTPVSALIHAATMVTAGVYMVARAGPIFTRSPLLAAGSVIHALSGQQDMRRMGGLAKRIPVTAATFVIGALAIAGVPPFAGFFSKDEILLHAYQRAPVLYAVGTLTAFLTAFYVFRAVFLTFYGASRVNAEAEHHVHESPAVMLVPLVILAALSVVGGWVSLSQWLFPVKTEMGQGLELTLMGISAAAGLAGIALAYWIYIARPQLSQKMAEAAGALYRLVSNKYYVDEIYGAVVVRPALAVSTHFLWKVMDAGVIDGAVNQVGRQSAGVGDWLRRMQSGNLRSYAGWVVLGAVAVVAALGAFFSR